MNSFHKLAGAYRTLNAAKNTKAPKVHTNDAEGSKAVFGFGPKSPCNNDDLLSLEDELERDLRKLCARINHAFSFEVTPRRGADLARWLGAHVDEVAEWNPQLAAEAEEKARSQTEIIDRALDHKESRTHATPRQSERLVERLSAVQPVLSCTSAAKLLSQYFGAEIDDQAVRRASKKFGVAGKRDGVVQVRLDHAIAHFHDKEVKR